MTATIERVKGITKADTKHLASELEKCPSVQRWIKRGSPAEDIEMEVRNVVNNYCNIETFRRLLIEQREKYKVENGVLIQTGLAHLSSLAKP